MAQGGWTQRLVWVGACCVACATAFKDRAHGSDLAQARADVEARRPAVEQCLARAAALGTLKARHKSFALGPPKSVPPHGGDATYEALVTCVRAEVKPAPPWDTLFFLAPEGVEETNPLGLHAHPLATAGGVTLSYDVGTLVAPRKLFGPDPEYTAEALRHEVEGSMQVRCVIDRAGTPKECRVLKSLPFMGEAALKALSERRYAPARWNDEPVDLEQVFNITLKNPGVRP